MNLHNIVSKVLRPIRPIESAIWHKYISQDHNRGKPISKYEDIEISVTKELVSATQLKHYEGLDYTLPYWFIWVSAIVDTQNIALKIGGDYITISNTDYKIVAQVENFGTGWVKIIGTPQ